jgi:hypothetical protein
MHAKHRLLAVIVRENVVPFGNMTTASQCLFGMLSYAGSFSLV